MAEGPQGTIGTREKEREEASWSLLSPSSEGPKGGGFLSLCSIWARDLSGATMVISRDGMFLEHETWHFGDRMRAFLERRWKAFLERRWKAFLEEGQF